MHEDRSLPQRVVVLGTTGSGKTTLARAIAPLLGARHVELDALFHEPGWTPAVTGVFRARVSEAIGGADRWVTDGNYSHLVPDITWAAADTVIWLDYSFARTFSRLLRRTLRRSLSGEELWNGNRERLRGQFMSRDSLLLWAVKTHWRHRREWPVMLREPPYAHLRVVRVRTPRALDAYVRALRAAATGAAPS